MPSTPHLLTTFLLLLGVTTAASAVPVINGDFETGDLTGYFTEDDAYDPNPDIGVSLDPITGNHFASIDTSHASYANTLGQDLTLPGAPAVLSFDFGFATADDGSFDAGAGFPDSFAVGLTTAGGAWLDILVVDLLGPLPDPSDGIEGLTGATPIDVVFDPSVSIPGFAPGSGATAYGGAISVSLPASVLGEGATLAFDLFDEEDGARTVAAVDNIAIAAGQPPSPAVPEPATGVLLGVGLVAGAGWVTRRGGRRCG